MSDRILANSFVTGHRPKETFPQLIARVNANSFIGELPVDRELKKAKQRRKPKALQLAEQLPQDELRVVVDILQNRAVVAYVQGLRYYVRKMPDGYAVRCMHPFGPLYVVSAGACTCPDSKFRDRECKHVSAIKEAGI